MMLAFITKGKVANLAVTQCRYFRLFFQDARLRFFLRFMPVHLQGEQSQQGQHLVILLDLLTVFFLAAMMISLNS